MMEYKKIWHMEIEGGGSLGNFNYLKYLVPVLFFGVVLAYRVGKKKKNGFLYIIIPIGVVYILVFFKSAYYISYWITFLPVVFLMVVLLFTSVQDRMNDLKKKSRTTEMFLKSISLGIVMICFWPYRIGFFDNLNANLYNLVQSFESISGYKLHDKRTIRQIDMDDLHVLYANIPQEERNSVYFWGFDVMLTQMFLEDITPVGKYFFCKMRL